RRADPPAARRPARGHHVLHGPAHRRRRGQGGRGRQVRERPRRERREAVPRGGPARRGARVHRAGAARRRRAALPQRRRHECAAHPDPRRDAALVPRRRPMTSGPAAGLPPMNGPGFASGTASVNGTTLHYERGGEGPTVLLIHGFPQDLYEWRHVMPRLARRFSVVAVDLRGVDGSAAPATGYDAACMATDVAELVEGLAVGPVHVVGHDVGGWVAYALARLRPELVRTLLVMETLLPGIQPADAPPVEVPLWHG